MVPIASYTIWFSQRTGSSFLSTELEQTGIAGIPHEWLLTPVGVRLIEQYDVKDGEGFVAALHRL